MLKRVWNFTKRSRSKFVAVVSAVAVAVSGFSLSLPMITATDTVSVSAASSVKNYEGLTDGTILHAFCWSFDTIKANMKNIADAGYTAIQTSPINAVNDSYPTMKLMGNDSSGGTDGAWWWHYQPTDWKIGNYQLGTRDQFKAMCAEADKYGIKIIVDVVPNHTTPALDKVAQDLINAANGSLYHPTGFEDIGKWSDRYDCTRKKMGGLPDVDTENTGFQNYFIAFLNDCIACGADGFRYDTAKHIGLPDDATDPGVNNNFWTRVTTEITNASNIFNYGEVLQGDNERVEAYIAMLGSTCTSKYGETIRNAVTGMNVTSGSVMGYQVGSAPTKNLVTWVESHDNYINDGTWSQLDDTQVKLAWAIITARQDGIPLFFDRPNGGGPSNKWGTNIIGVAGSDLYRDDEVVAVNKFRTAMAKGSNSEYLRNPNGDSNVLMIERGTAGVVIVNTKYSSYYVNSATNLADGTYYSHTDDGSKFVVENGVITGTVPSRGISVLYKDQGIIDPSTESESETEPVTEKITMYFEKPDSWNSAINAYVYKESGTSVSEVAEWPGVAMTKVDGNIYKITVSASYDGGNIIFNDGTNQAPAAQQTGVVVKDKGLYNTGGYAGTYQEESESESESETEVVPGTTVNVYFQKPNDWASTVNAYVYKESGTSVSEAAKWPGAAMTKVADNIYKLTVSSDYVGGNVIFNDGTNQAPAALQTGFIVKANGLYTVNGYSGTYVEGVEPSIVTGVTAAYVDGKIKITWDDNGAEMYKVVRSDGRSGYQNLTYSATAAGWTDSKNLVEAQLYYYRVIGYFKDAEGNLIMGEQSEAAAVVATDSLPEKVENVKAALSGKNVALTWDAADSARYYKVSRAAGAAGKYYSMKYNIEPTSYTDSNVPANLYRYKVVGYYKDVDSSWVYGELSDTLYVTVK